MSVLFRVGLAAGLSLQFAAVASGQATSEDFPPELTRFRSHTANPVFTAAGEGTWEQRIRERGWILRENGHYKMWYTGYDGTREGQKKLGLATSRDGVRWTRRTDQPIYDKHWVEDMMVVRRNGEYFMFAEGAGDRAQLLRSDDGVQWRRVGVLDVRQSNGKPISEGPYGTPTALFREGQWLLFYERRDAGVWLAASRDMKVWTNVSDEPVLSPGDGEHERVAIALNQVVEHNGVFYAMYHGAGDPEADGKRLWSTCIAKSRDLKHWTKFAGNPLLPKRENKSSGLLIPAPDRRSLWLYTMHDQVCLHRPIAVREDQTPRRNNLPEAASVQRNLEYVPDGHPRQVLDFYTPETPASEPPPLVVWIHGGGWRAGSKDRPRGVRRLLREGFAVASLNYRLSQHATFPAQAHDCKAALRFLRKNAKRLGFDPNRIGVWGASAGGHLAALIGVSSGAKELEGKLGATEVSSRVQAVCDWFGPTDLLRMNEQAGDNGALDHDAPNSPESILLGGPLQQSPQQAALANPIRYVRRDAPPFLIMHGSEDRLVPPQQSRMLHAALRKVGAPADLVIVDGAGHGFRDAESLERVVTFFREQLGSAP